MTGLWTIFLGYAWDLAAAAFIALVLIGLLAPVSDDDEDDTDGWDRGHDHDIDRRNGVSL